MKDFYVWLKENGLLWPMVFLFASVFVVLASLWVAFTTLLQALTH